MKLTKKLLFDSRDRRVWSIHERRQHIGFVEAAPTGYSARRADGKQMKQIVPTSQLACAWLLAKRLGIENESRAKGRALVRVRTLPRKPDSGNRSNQGRSEAAAAAGSGRV